MPEIRVLPRHLVNKIAAGEVIERPSSVVKELAENALDAGATAIDITVEDGGKRLISVRDNGKGMSADDLALAFTSHATSKIATDEDLFNIHTMGFRGEALASIAAVSHAQIITRRRGEPQTDGFEIHASGDDVEPVRPAPASEGTILSVRDLFFNVPARRKFLRSAETEFGHITEQLARLALPNGPVSFSLTHNGRCTHKLPGADCLGQRVADLFDEQLAGGLIELDSQEKGTRIHGLIGPPALGKASARWQYFFVNGRYVRDRFLAHALKDAYRGLMDPSRSPAAFIFIELDAGEVDVNVHPAKIEVRFRNSQLLHSQLVGCLREALRGQKIALTVSLPGGESPEEPLADADAEQRRQSLKQALADFFKSMPAPQPHLGFGQSPGSSDPGHSGPADDRPVWARPAPSPEPVSLDAGQAMTPPLAAAVEDPWQGQWISSRPAGAAADTSRAVQVHNSYILTADEEGILIIDQHALHERIMYEELSARLAAGPLAGQRLLIPQILAVSEADKAALAGQAELLDRLGIEWTEFGPGKLALQRFPVLLSSRHVQPDEFMAELLGLLHESDRADGAALFKAILSTMACKAAIKAGDPLSGEEIAELLSRRVAADNASSCPHGRPTTLKLSLAELAKQFKRT